MGHTPVGATAALAAVGGYAALYRLGQTWAPPARSTAAAGRRRAAARRQGLDHPCDHDRGARTCGLAVAGADGLGTGRLVHLPLGRPAPVPGQRPQRQPHPSGAPAAARGRSRPRRPAGGRLLVHRSGWRRTGCWCCGRPGTCRCRGASGGWRWTGSGAGTWSEPIGGCTRVIQRNRMRLHPWWFERAFLPRSSRRTSSWLAATCAACSDGPRPRQARRPPPGHWPDSGVPTGNPRWRLDVVERLGRSAA